MTKQPVSACLFVQIAATKMALTIFAEAIVDQITL